MTTLHAQATRALDAARKADAARTQGEWDAVECVGANRDERRTLGTYSLVHNGQAEVALVRGFSTEREPDAAFIADLANRNAAVLDLIEATIADPTEAGADSGPGVCYRLALRALGVTEYDEGND